jgi:hypothetical protein
MNTLINRLQPNENINLSLDIGKLDFSDCLEINLGNLDEFYIGKNSRSAAMHTSALIAVILLSHPTKFFGVPQNLNEYIRVDFKQSQIPARPIFPSVDSRSIYVINEPEVKSADKAKLVAEFNKLVAQWREETFFQSSLGEIFTNESYQRIMAMGRDALPLILSELQKKPGHWFYALEKIVGYDVAGEAKNFADARAAWLEWGNLNDYI